MDTYGCVTKLRDICYIEKQAVVWLDDGPVYRSCLQENGVLMGLARLSGQGEHA
ncbi:hypothetical protein GCM10027076_28100 [Nocardioides montaniterrae]